MATHDIPLESAAASHPQIGMLATVRNRRAIVASVEPFDTPSGRFHVVRLEYTDLEGAAQETIVWEIEHGRKLLPPHALPRVGDDAPMPAADFDALVRSARWSALAPFLSTENPTERSTTRIAAPFFGAVEADDFQLVPLRLGGTNLNFFLVRDMPGLTPHVVTECQPLLRWLAAVVFPNPVFARARLGAAGRVARRDVPWKRQWAVTPAERLRFRVLLDVLVAKLFDLTEDEFRWIFRGCDQPVTWLARQANSRSLEPRGFWRTDRWREPELRHTVLAQVAFRELNNVGFVKFLNLNDGEGWMLPETLRLSEYGLGHDDRAREPQPVASILGPRFHPWQCERSAAESWRECELHADLLRRISEVSDKPEAPEADPPQEAEVPTNLFGNPLETDLFGNVVTGRRKEC